MSKIIASDSELYNHIVEMLSNGNFLQLNGKSINLTELNEYMNVQQQENERLNNIINKLERRFNQELENNEKWDIEDTKQFYSKKWYKDTLNDFKNMIKN